MLLYENLDPGLDYWIRSIELSPMCHELPIGENGQLCLELCNYPISGLTVESERSDGGEDGI